MIVVIKIELTCASHPSQWEGRTSDDRAIYIRYRYGGFPSVSRSLAAQQPTLYVRTKFTANN